MRFFKPKPPRKQDFREQIFKILMKKLKVLKLFLIQKAVKKLRDSQKPCQEAWLVSLKKLNNNDFQLIALTIMIEKNIDLSRKSQFFEKILPDYGEKIKELSKNHKEIIEKMKKLKRFEDISQEIEAILAKVQKKIAKSKVSRKILKEKHRKKNTNSKDITKEIKENSEDIKKIIIKENNGDSLKKTNKIRKNEKIIKENTKKSLEKPHIPIKIPPKSDNFAMKSDKITTDYLEIHPSWQASLQRRAEEKTSHFQGTRKKLI